MDAAAHSQFTVDAMDVRLDGAHDDVQFFGDLLVLKPCCDELQHFEFALTQRLNARIGSGGYRPGRLLKRREQPAHIMWATTIWCSSAPLGVCFAGVRQELCHQGSFVHKGADVTFRFGQLQGTLQGAKRPPFIALRSEGQGLEDQDLYYAVPSPLLLRRG